MASIDILEVSLERSLSRFVLSGPEGLYSITERILYVVFAQQWYLDFFVSPLKAPRDADWRMR